MKKPRRAADLSKTVCMDLARGFHRVRAEMVAHAERYAREAGVEASLLALIHVLGLRGPTRMSDLAERTVIAAPSITRRAKQLEALGLAVRERAPTSDREVLIRLTEAGRALFERSFRFIHDEHARYFDDRLGAAEQRQLLALLERLR